VAWEYFDLPEEIAKSFLVELRRSNCIGIAQANNLD